MRMFSQADKYLIEKVQHHINKEMHMIVIDAQKNEDLDLIASAIQALEERSIIGRLLRTCRVSSGNTSTSKKKRKATSLLPEV